MTVNCKPQVNLVHGLRRERGPQVKEREGRGGKKIFLKREGEEKSNIPGADGGRQLAAVLSAGARLRLPKSDV